MPPPEGVNGLLTPLLGDVTSREQGFLNMSIWEDMGPYGLPCPVMHCGFIFQGYISTPYLWTANEALFASTPRSTMKRQGSFVFERLQI